jgi:hypothetical protein
MEKISEVSNKVSSEYEIFKNVKMGVYLESCLIERGLVQNF